MLSLVSTIASYSGLFADCVPGHQHLVNNHLLLHRDISSGNVLMAVDPETEGVAGFVCDIELSKKLTRMNAEGVPQPANSTNQSPELTVNSLALSLLHSLLTHVVRVLRSLWQSRF